LKAYYKKECPVWKDSYASQRNQQPLQSPEGLALDFVDSQLALAKMRIKK